MPHSFVPLQFNPELTAYWLPPSGQLAAAKIDVDSFWALRTNWAGNERDPAPGFIFVISSDPSPFPLQNASLSLGPRLATDTGAHCDDATALRTTKPMKTIQEDLSLPLYLHTVPMLTISPYARHPIKTVRYQLDKPSLKKFLDVAHELQDAARAFREWHKRRHSRTGGSEHVQEDWSTFGEGDRYVLGGRNDPKAYVFKFIESPPFPSLEGAGNIYHEIWQYKQVCKDYKWTGAEQTIDWVRDTRKNIPSVSQRDFEACVAAPASPSVVLSDPLWRANALLLSAAQYPPIDPDAVAYDSDNESEFMETTFPMCPVRFPSVSMPVRVRTLAFDLFGTILNRDGAIHDALTPWTFVSGCRKTAAQLTRIYLEREALINYHSSTTPISLARVVHSALTDVSERLDLRISPHSAMFNDSMTRILAPTLFPDVEPAVTALAARGIRLVCFPPHSLTTTAHYKSRLPRAFLDHVSFSPIAAPVHTEAPRDMFRSISDEHILRPRMSPHPDLQPDRDSEILVVSTGVGRILAPAIRGKFATALLKRPESVEANVDFCIGRKPGDNPDPLLVVDGLMELCAALKLL